MIFTSGASPGSATGLLLTGLSSLAGPAAGEFAYSALAFAVGIECLGLPFPGETALIAAAIYAGATHRLDIFMLVGAAAAGSTLGGALGFWLGRRFGLPLLLRHGALIGMTPPRIRLGQYLFVRHGGKLVFFARFVVFLRSLSAFLAGANRMDWPRFMACNALGAIVWTSLFGFGAFYLGSTIHHLLWPVALALGLGAGSALLIAIRYVRRNEQRLGQEAERALPGPLSAFPPQGKDG